MPSSPTTLPSTDNLTGLWATRLELADNRPIQLSLEHAAGVWLAKAAGVDLTAGDDGLFGGADGAQLRLRKPAPSDDKIRGHWVQPRSFSFSYRQATPVVLTRSTTGWSGEVTPAADVLELYLSISAGEEGKLTAFVREPGRNVGRQFGEMAVSISGETVRFVGRGEREAFSAKLTSSDSLQITIEDIGKTMTLTRRNRANAPGFYPRPESEPSYVYAQPKSRAGDWPVASLSDVGLETARVSAAVQTVLATETSSWTSPNLHALLVARRGKLVLEEYFYGARFDQPHDTRSAGKSFASTLVGLAVSQGLLSVETKIERSMGAFGKDRRRKEMTVEHLITMNSGLECDDDDYDNSKGNEDRMQNQSDEPDWHSYTWNLQMVRSPGEKAVYCSGGINLVGAPLAASTKAWIPDFFATALAEPLGFSAYHFNLMPTGQGYLGGGIRLRPRDFIKLGQLFLNDGKWAGKRLLKSSWIADASKPHSGINVPNDYGYGWWRHTFEINGKAIEAIYASGNGGQMVIVVPSLEIAIATMAGNYGNYPTWKLFRDELAKEIIASAID